MIPDTNIQLNQDLQSNLLGRVLLRCLSGILLFLCCFSFIRLDAQPISAPRGGIGLLFLAGAIGKHLLEEIFEKIVLSCFQAVGIQHPLDISQLLEMLF